MKNLWISIKFTLAMCVVLFVGYVLVLRLVAWVASPNDGEAALVEYLSLIHISRIISLEGYDVAQAEDCAAGLKLLERYAPDVVLCDVKLPDGNGVDMAAKIKAAAPEVEVILLTAYGNIPDGVQAIKNGAFDYITKGDDNNKILPLLARAMRCV